jgi:hypothetical protein
VVHLVYLLSQIPIRNLKTRVSPSSNRNLLKNYKIALKVHQKRKRKLQKKKEQLAKEAKKKKKKALKLLRKKLKRSQHQQKVVEMSLIQMKQKREKRRKRKTKRPKRENMVERGLILNTKSITKKVVIHLQLRV